MPEGDLANLSYRVRNASARNNLKNPGGQRQVDNSAQLNALQESYPEDRFLFESSHNCRHMS